MPGHVPPEPTPTERVAGGPRPEFVETARLPAASSLTPTPDPAVPQRLGPYKLLGRLGAGGMGVVFRAFDTTLERAVALKVLRPDLRDDARARARFLREAKAAAAVRNDHVVTTFQVGEEAGTPFMAMELLQGTALDDYLTSQKPLAVADIVRIGREAALGLAAAHERGLVHRDIKPSNLWLETPGGRVKILDFGLALPAGDAERLTSTGVVLGTPAYMSPEQARDDAVDHRSDLFSLGGVLYRLLTGRLPFPGSNTLAVLTALAADTPPPVRFLVPDAPRPLADLIDQLLAKRPVDRPPSAAEVAKRLAAVDTTPLAPTPPPPPEPVVVPAAATDWRDLVTLPPEPDPEPPRRHWLPAAALIVAMLAGTAAVVRTVDPEGKVLADLAAQLKPGSADKPEAFSPKHSFWRRLDGKGYFEKVAKWGWLEYTSDQPGGPFELTEQEGTSDYVVLYDQRRRQALRLSADRIEAETDGQWRRLYSGTWADPPKGKPPG